MGRPRKITALHLGLVEGGAPPPPVLPEPPLVVEVEPDVHMLEPLYRTRVTGAKVRRVVRQPERMVPCPDCQGSSYPDPDLPYLCGSCHGAGVRALVETVIEVDPPAAPRGNQPGEEG